MEKMKFSLKFKILAGVSTLLAICTTFSLVYSYKLFIEDKTSYIFENGLIKAENIRDQINFKFNEIIARTNLNSMLINTQFVNFDNIINNQNELLLTGVAEFKDNSFLIFSQFPNVAALSKLNESYGVTKTDILNEVLAKANNPNLIPKNRVWIFSPQKNLKLLLHISKITPNNFVYFSIADLSQMLEIFHNDRIYTNQIISLNSEADHLENEIWLSRTNYKISKTGAFESKVKGQDVLLSYAFINDKTIVVSSIRKSEAFGITKILILKTVIFAIVLLGFAIVLGIYFSSSITFPISLLTINAKKIAAGDFSSKAEVDTTDEIKILSDTFNFMTNEIKGLLKNKEMLILKLEDYSKNLEIMVEKRTIELKAANDFMALMVNSLDQGLLVFDENLKIHSMFTKACEPIFGMSPANKTLPEILDDSSENHQQNLLQWAQIIFKELIPFESAVELGPRKKVNGHNFLDSDYKFIQIDYYPMRDAEEKVSNVVLIATDKTKEIQATEMAKEKESYVSMILKILNSKPQFESFINDVDDIFDQFINAYSIEEEKIEFDLCMMLFHTLNGGFSIYNISKLQLLARKNEDEISKIKNNPDEVANFIPILQKNIENLKQEFINFKAEFDALVGTKFSSNQRYTEISYNRLLDFKQLIEEGEKFKVREYFLENFLKVPIVNYFKAYDDLCKTVSVKINKEFHGLTFHNSKLKIEPEKFLEFFNVLVHLFRNCLDHGLEDPYTRKSKGKSPDGHISVSFDEIHLPHGKLLSVVIQDDGAGIDPEKIRASLLKLNPNDHFDHIPDEKIIYKIFDPFFSTRNEVSNLSGRGIGMSAIKDVVDRLKGQIEIESKLGQGTSFFFLIPF